MLAALAQLDPDPKFVAALAEVFNIGTADGAMTRTEALRFYKGPIIVHQSPWMADIPDWMFTQARAERAEIVFGDSPYIVGPTEIAAVMYPATMEHPLPYESTQLYLWATANASARHRQLPICEIWKMIGSEPITDEQVCCRGGKWWETYRDLASEIRRKVIAHQTQRDRAEKRPPLVAKTTDETEPKPEPEKPEIVGVQLDLFSL